MTETQEPQVLTPEQARAFADQQALMQNAAMMQQIVREMKEIAELPSEVPTDVNVLLRVEFPDEGGVLTYMENHEQPYKGFPFFEFVDKIDVIKKTQRAVLSSLYHSLKARPWWQLAGLICVPWLFGDILRSFIYTFYRSVDRFKIKPLRYSTAIRELHRAFSVEWHDENPKSRETRLMIRDIMCMLLEFDNAYRFRFQDVVVELDKAALEKNPGKELTRLFKVLSSRETHQEVKDTWKLVLYFFPLYLRLNGDFRKSVVGVLTKLDLEKVALAVEDKHYCDKRKDYQFAHKECQ